MNYDLRTRIRAKKQGKVFHTTVQLFVKHKKRHGKSSVIDNRKDFMIEIRKLEASK